jgi:hypothetical protein
MDTTTYLPRMWEIIEKHAPAEIWTAVEIGTREGHWASGFLKRFQDRLGRLFCVDPWAETHNKRFQWENVFPAWRIRVFPHLWSKVIPLRGRSQEWGLVFNEKIDLLYIDGDHTAEGFRRDVELWVPKVAPGGLVICHDYHLPAVRSMANKMFSEDINRDVVGPKLSKTDVGRAKRGRRYATVCWFNKPS